MTSPTGPADLLEWWTGLHSALDVKMGLELLELGTERLVGRMPVAGNTQPVGLWHGGASCVLAETVGSIGAALHAGSLDKVAVGIDINATHHRAVRDGSVRAIATALTLGSGVACYEIVIEAADGVRVCTARLTCALRPSPPR